MKGGIVIKNRNIFLVGGVLAVIIIIIVIIVIYTNTKTNEITDFYYYSGSSSDYYEFTGKRNDDVININFKEFNSGKEITNKYTIELEELKDLINSTTKENCDNHTYEAQCGDSVGCSSSYFYVYSGDNENERTCYIINDNISSFFENLSKEK